MTNGEAPMTNQVRMPNPEHSEPQPELGVSGLVIDWSLGLGHSPFRSRSRAGSELHLFGKGRDRRFSHSFLRFPICRAEPKWWGL
jgi:hypothetical protein